MQKRAQPIAPPPEMSNRSREPCWSNLLERLLQALAQNNFAIGQSTSPVARPNRESPQTAKAPQPIHDCEALVLYRALVGVAAAWLVRCDCRPRSQIPFLLINVRDAKFVHSNPARR